MKANIVLLEVEIDQKDTPEKKQGKLIRVARESKGWTQKQLASRVGLSPRAISKIECGHGTTSVMIFRIAKALGQSIQTFEV